MTDIGFGLLDRRTVITVLFTLVLMQLLFGLQIPVDIKNVVQLFIDLVVLTGYIYLARTIYRLPVAVIISLVQNIKNIVDYFKKPNKESGKESKEETKEKEHWFKEGIKFLFFGLLALILFPIFFIVSFLISVLTFGETMDKEYPISYRSLPKKLADIYYDFKDILDAIFGILDRVGVVAVAVIATIPSLRGYVQAIGVGGLVVMILLFTLRGDFTALLKDILEKSKKGKDKEKSEQSVEVKNTRSSPLYVEIVNSDERPITVNNKRDDPLFIEHAGWKSSPFPVSIEFSNIRLSDPLPVHVTNSVETHSIFSSPVEIVNEVTINTNSSLPVEITNDKKTPLPVEVTNIVTVENNDQDY